MSTTAVVVDKNHNVSGGGSPDSCPGFFVSKGCGLSADGDGILFGAGERDAAVAADHDADGDGNGASSDSSSCSSLGKNSDDENDNDLDEDEVQSSYTYNNNNSNNEEENNKISSSLLDDAIQSLEEALPIRRGMSQFYDGKSKSFTSLADAVSSSYSSSSSIAKPENAYTRRRKSTLAHSLMWDKKNRSSSSGNLQFIIRSTSSNTNGSCHAHGGISKRSITNLYPNRTTLALAVAMSSSGTTDTRTVDDLNSKRQCLMISGHPKMSSPGIWGRGDHSPLLICTIVLPLQLVNTDPLSDGHILLLSLTVMIITKKGLLLAYILPTS